MRAVGTDHVISGPMRGLEINFIQGHKTHEDTLTDIATLRLNCPVGPFIENLSLVVELFQNFMNYKQTQAREGPPLKKIIDSLKQ